MSIETASQSQHAIDTQDENILNVSEILRIVRFSWKLILGIVLIFLFIALVLSLVLPKKWEASATLRIARVPSDSGLQQQGEAPQKAERMELIENPLQTVERMKHIGFKEKVLSNMQLPTEKGVDDRTDLILSSLKTNAVKNTEFINITVLGYSKKEALTTIQVATSELQTIHAQMTRPIRNRINNELLATNKNLSTTVEEQTNLKNQIAHAGIFQSASEFSSRVLAMKLLTDTDETRRTLELQQIQLKDRLSSIDEQSTTLVSTINLPKKAIFPKLSVFLVLGGILGMITGIAVAIRKNKK